MRDLFYKDGFVNEYSARPILVRMYAGIFCYSITLADRPYILFNFSGKPLNLETKNTSDTEV